MFRFFKKREEVFHKLIQEQASITYDGLMLLVKYLETEAPEIAEQLALKEKEADGWKYGAVKNPETKEHPCYVPYEQLPAEQQKKDALFIAIVHSLA